MKTLIGPVLVIGARSDIGRAIAMEFAKAGLPLILAGRGAKSLEADAADIALRHSVPVRAVECDVLNVDPKTFFDSLGETPRIVVSVVGYMGDQQRAQVDAAHAKVVMDSNYAGPALLLGEAADRLVATGGEGAIIGVSSVAGDRGRSSNYVYGSAKAGLTAFLSGLRHRLAATQILVMTVKPGFVRTQMTAGMPLPKPLTAEPAEVATTVVAAVRSRREVVYVRPVWWVIMTIISHLPEFVFKKMKV